MPLALLLGAGSGLGVAAVLTALHARALVPLLSVACLGGACAFAAAAE